MRKQLVATKTTSRWNGDTECIIRIYIYIDGHGVAIERLESHFFERFEIEASPYTYPPRSSRPSESEPCSRGVVRVGI